jgi:type I restriction enzyme M protein
MASQANSGSDLGFEADLFKAADKLRGNLEPSEYKHVALGLIFLKYISEAFAAHYARLGEEDYADQEDPEEYLAANVFWVPPEARWAHLQANAKLPKIKFTDVNTGKEREGDIGNLIDNAMDAIEKANAAVLKDVLPKDYGRPQLDKTMLGELIDLFSKVGMHGKDANSKDLLGRAYEYFISQFAGAEGRRGGEFFTPRSVVQTIVEMLEPHNGRVYDPCCGSGGMFVQSERFIESHEGRRSDIAIYGQERNHTTWKLCKMNLAVRGIDADIKWNNEGSFLNDAFPMLKFDYAMANSLEIWHATSGQCEFCMVAAYHPPPCPARHGGCGAGQWFHVIAAIGRRGHPQDDGRTGRGRLHGRAAGTAILFDTNSRLPVVSGAGQERQWPPRPAR